MKNRGVIDCRILGIVGMIVLTVTLSYSMMGCSEKENEPSKAIKDFRAAEAMFAQEDYKGAIEKWEQFIKEHPKDPSVREALEKIGVSHELLNNYKEALSSYHKILEDFPNDAEAGTSSLIRRVQRQFFTEAVELFKDKQYKEAYEAFDRFADDEQLKDYSRADSAMYNTAVCLERQGKYDAALKRYETFTKNFPASKLMPNALFQIGFLNHTIKADYEQSRLDFQKFLEQSSRSDRVDKARVDEATVGIVLNLSKLKRFDGISDQVDNFKRRFPTNKWLAILESYKKGIEPFGYAMSELTLWERKLEWENARTAFEEILRNKQLLQGISFNLKADVESHIARLYLDEGNDHYKRKAYKASRETFGTLLKQYPNSDLKGEARRLIAQSYLDEMKYNQAYINFDTLISTEFDGSPVQSEAMYKAAYSLKSLSIDDGDGSSNYEIVSKALSDEVLVQYTEFLTRFPDSKYVSDAYFDQGKIYAAQKKYGFALNRYGDALRNTDNPKRRAEIQVAIGRVYFNQSIEASEEADKTVFDNKAIEAWEEAVKAAEQAIEADIENAKLDRARARSGIVHIHIQRKEWDVVRDIYKDFIEAYGEAGYEATTSEFGEPIETDLMVFCTYRIGEAYHEMKDFRKALEWYEKIVKEKGFQADDSIPDSLKKRDFRTDAIAPRALYKALLIHNKLEGTEKLEGIANKYINDIRDDNPLLSAKARFNFAKMKREVLPPDYKGAAQEFAKLAAYRGSDLRLNLIKLQGKYYEGSCYKKLASSKDAEAAYKKAIMLFNLNFQRLIDTPNIKPLNISKKVFDYCIQTALEYAEKACAEIKDTEYTKKVCAEIKEARRKLEDKDKTMQKSDASNNPNSSEASQTKGQMTAQGIAQKASGSTVLLVMEKNGGRTGVGSGFFVRSDLIATNYHVIEGAEGGTARLVGTDREYAIIGYTAIDAERDLAILKVRAFGIQPLPLANRNSIKVNSDVYAVGNPLGRSYLEGTVSYGKISALRKDPSRKWIQITAPMTHGNSGGPVVNNKGEVIGVSTLITLDDEHFLEYKVKDSKGQEIGYVKLPRRREQNLNFAVHVDELKALLNLIGPPKPLSDLEIIY